MPKALPQRQSGLLNNDTLVKYLGFIEKKLGTEPRPGVEENLFYYDKCLRQDLSRY